eukprot:6903911-Lingulodinium_polyedra.AAC.1
MSHATRARRADHCQHNSERCLGRRQNAWPNPPGTTGAGGLHGHAGRSRLNVAGGQPGGDTC